MLLLSENSTLLEHKYIHTHTHDKIEITNQYFLTIDGFVEEI